MFLFQYYEQSDDYEQAMDILNIVFTSLFTLECLFKLFAFRFKVSKRNTQAQPPQNTTSTSNPRQPSTFLPQNLVKCGICYAKVCLSVRPSVTLVSHALSKCALDHTIEGRF